MKYSEIIKQLAQKNNVSPKEIEKEMKQALMMAGIKCSVEQFLEMTKNTIERLYIV